MITRPVTRDTLLVGGAALAALLLRLFRLGNQSLWLDEAASVEVAALPWVNLIAPHGYYDIHPPIYFLVLKPFHDLATAFPEFMEFALRLPAAIASAGMSFAVYSLGVALFDRRVGAIAAMAVVPSAYLVYHGQECRMYSLAMLLVTWQMTIGVRLACGPGSLASWLGMYLVSTAATLTHWFAAVVWLPMLVYALAMDRSLRNIARWTVLCAASLGTALVYFFPRAIGGSGGSGLAPAGWKNFAYALWGLWTGHGAGPSSLELHGPDPLAAVARFLPSVLLLGSCAAVTVVTVASVVVRRVPRRRALFLALWFVIALVAPMVPTGEYHKPRYAFAALPPLVILLAAAIRYTDSKRIRAAIVAPALLAQLWAVGNYLWRPHYWNVDYRAAARHLREHPELRGSLATSTFSKRVVSLYGAGEWVGHAYRPHAPWSDEFESWLATRERHGQGVTLLTGERWWQHEKGIVERFDRIFSREDHRHWHGLDLWSFAPRR